MDLRPCLTALALAVASTGIHAKPDTQEQNGKSIPAISEWNYDALYENGGINSDKLMDAEVFGPEGEEIGSVENIVLNDSNEIIGLIAQVGGVWDIGDTHIAVPWQKVTVTDDGVKIPVTESNAEDYEMFGPQSFITPKVLEQAAKVGEDTATGPKTWKLTSLLDDYVTLKGGRGHGYVNDVIFSDEGKIKALVVAAVGNYPGANTAYPFYGYEYGWNPGNESYELPYDKDDIENVKPFDYEQFEDQ